MWVRAAEVDEVMFADLLPFGLTGVMIPIVA